jgi:hypothetical protein
MSANLKPSFVCAYDGVSEYRWNGKLWRCRYMEAMGVRPSYKPECDALIGCVYGCSDGGIHEFPPAELLAHFPGYVGAAYVPNGTQREVEWTGGKFLIDNCDWQFQGTPRVADLPTGRHSAAWAEELAGYEARRAQLIA